MQIHDFYSKFASVTEKCNLFEALRSLSLVENLNSLFDDGVRVDWSPWPPMESAVAMAAEA